jgi:hypothetical protein
VNRRMVSKAPIVGSIRLAVPLLLEPPNLLRALVALGQQTGHRTTF